LKKIVEDGFVILIKQGGVKKYWALIYTGSKGRHSIALDFIPEFEFEEILKEQLRKEADGA
jgi:hypothetical protein